MAHEPPAAQGRLLLAVVRGGVIAARLALDDGADVSRVDQYGDSPLRTAVRHGRVDVARFLLDRGADLHERNHEQMPNPGGSLLHDAVVARRNRVAITRLLVDRGLNVSQTDDRGDAPLHVAAMHGHADVASFLLDRGADINKPGRFGFAPLQELVLGGNADVTRLLLRIRFSDPFRNGSDGARG